MLPVSVVVATAVFVVMTDSGDDAAPAVPTVDRVPLSLGALVHYADPDLGFGVAVPDGWRASVVAESDAQRLMYEPGYAVGFESPREGVDDPFADYLMIEILPGDESGLFVTDGSRRRSVEIDGRRAWRDALRLSAAGVPHGMSAPDGSRPAEDPGGRASASVAVDLLVLQAATRGLGYTVGFFAIGEPSNAVALGDAFEAMLRTFRLPRAPFDVS